MAEPGKSISIRIAASGGDAAAAEIRKVDQAEAAMRERMKQAETASSTGFGGMLDGTQARNEAHEVRLKQISDEGEALEKVAQAGAKEDAAEVEMLRRKSEASKNFVNDLERAPTSAGRGDITFDPATSQFVLIPAAAEAGESDV